MRTVLRLGGMLAALAALAGGAQAGEPSAAPPAKPQLSGIEAYGKELFDARCSNCHSIEQGKSSLAPTMHGVIGRKAGGVEGFPYSEKIARLDLTWTPESLDVWLKSQSLDSPILRMRHLGVTEDGDRQSILAYLATLK